MAKLTLGQKADRVLKLLMGMRNARVVSSLSTRGFGQDDVEEGWTLLRNVARGRFDVPTVQATDPSVITELDLWENTWFPVAQASLQRRFPVVAERVFLNLSQTEGPGVVLSVSTFVDRISTLAAATDQESVNAWALLNRRGLTLPILEQARALLVNVRQAAPAAPLDLDSQLEDIDRAEAEMWNWYLEWSRIARAVITDRVLLRALGFLATTRSSRDDDEEEEATPVATSNSPSGIAPPLSSEVGVKAS